MEFDKTSGFFTAFRGEYGFPYFYQEMPKYLLREGGLWSLGISYILAVLTLTVLLAFLGTRGYSRWRIALQMAISLAIGFTIIVSLTGNSWQKAEDKTTENGIEMTYHLHVGLKQANISLHRVNLTDSSTIEFHNVKIGWIEVNQAEQEYREALLRGWPVGILKIAHYMSVDMGSMRYMRAFRWSGYAASILLWIAFSSWILANILIGSKVSYTALALLLTGCVQLITCIVYASEQPENFYIPLDRGEAALRLRYDWMFWATAFVGIFVVIMSVILLVLDYLRPADMNKFFGTQNEIQSPYDEELKINQNKDIKGMIRRISTRRRSAAHLKRRNNVDEEAKMAGGAGSGNGHTNGMKSALKVKEDKVETTSIDVPAIQVEMVDVKTTEPASETEQKETAEEKESPADEKNDDSSGSSRDNNSELIAVDKDAQQEQTTTKDADNEKKSSEEEEKTTTKDTDSEKTTTKDTESEKTTTDNKDD